MITIATSLAEFAIEVREFIQSAHSSEEEFNRLALSLYGLQFSHNAPYRQFCRARNIEPQMVKHWTAIPAMPAVGFKEFELTCLPPEQRTVVFHSSGTTDQRPSRHFHSADSLAVYEASLVRGFETHLLMGSQRDYRWVFLTPSPGEAPHSSLVHMFDCLGREFGSEPSLFAGTVPDDGGWALNVDATLKYLRAAIAENRPVMLCGTAFNFVHLLDALEATGSKLCLPTGSRVLETGGYKGRSRSLPKEELHALITRLLGVTASHIVCEYGMSELSSQAYDKVVGDMYDEAVLGSSRREEAELGISNFKFQISNGKSASSPRRLQEFANAPSARRVFYFPPWARAQIVSPETGRAVGEGETGLIRIFDLANVYSIMAMQTEDLGVRRGGGFELLGRAAGSEPRGCSLMCP